MPVRISSAAEFDLAIRARREKLGLRQSDIAMQSGVPTPTISAIENGKETTRFGLVLRICRALGLTVTVED